MNTELIDHIKAIFREAEHKALIVPHAAVSVSAQEFQLPPEWMTLTELAVYWRCFNKQGEPTTAGILFWVRRPADEYPLPHAYLGDMIRFQRDDVNQMGEERG